MVSNKTAKVKKHTGAWECIIAKLEVGLEGRSDAGNPEIIDSPYGDAVRFNGINDAIFLEQNPLKNLAFFTVEVLFRPDLDGPQEQRFLHIGEINGDRLLVETRLTSDGKWFLDTYIQSGESQKTLIDPKLVHQVGPWYHVALTLDKNGKMTNYVNGKKEIEGQVGFKPIEIGEMSIGVRRNKVSWYKGAIYKIKISPEVLGPEDFLPH
jgi:hypothetical protein